MNQNVLDHLDQITLGEPQHYKNMQVIPMMLRTPGRRSFITLKEGLKRGLVEITEISEGGSVPNLAVINNSDQPLLLIDGEELIGAKQNRIVNSTIMLAPRSKTIIPVSCTEAGRWDYKSKNFSDSGIIMERKARASKNMRMSINLKIRGKYDTDQSMLWKDIDDIHKEHSTSSRTSSMKDAFESKKDMLSDYINNFPLLEAQYGSMVFINAEPAGYDIVSRATAYSQLHEKYMKSYAMDALVNQINLEAPDLQIEGYKFLHAIKDAEETEHRPVGLGRDLRYEKDRFYGFALLVEDDVVHLSGFNAPSDKRRRPNRDREVFDFTF